MKSKVLFPFACLTVLLLTSCKDEGSGLAGIRVRLHDMPADYDSVLVEITGVLVHTDAAGWITLNSETGIYDLLQLQNGIDTLLVPTQQIGSGHLSQIRFILGDENSVVVNGVEYPLDLSSQDESGLKINVHQEILDGQDYLISVDFDAEHSILEQGDSSYKLKPVLTALIN